MLIRPIAHFPIISVVVALIGAVIFQPALAQQDRRSALFMSTGCQYLIDDPIAVTASQMEAAEVCANAVASILHFGRELQGNMAFCPPRGTEPPDAARHIVAFMRAHPERMGERFDLLSYGALRQAWPCH